MMGKECVADKKFVVLVVDDAPDNLLLMSGLLQEFYKVMVANNGGTALRIATSDTPPDIILLDIMMPHMDGYEVCRKLKADPKTQHIPVIFLTAKSKGDDEKLSLEIGAVDYITKPISPPIFLARVYNQLALYDKNRQLDRMVQDLTTANDELHESRQQLEVRNLLIRETFGSYLSEEVVHQILNTPEGMKVGGKKREVTILMADLRGFTSISEKMPAEEVVAMINIFLEEMIKIIFLHGGTINEFIGDAILVVFGAPIRGEDDPLRAVACALEMQQAMTKVNQRNRQAGYAQVAMGVGLNTGEAVVGNIGSEQRKKYAVVGKNVNLTSRIESYTVGGQILISESTRRACGNALRIDGEMVVMPKGVEHPITISDVGGISGRYQVQLPGKNLNLKHLPVPVPVFFSVLDAKEIGQTSYSGQLLEIGDGIGLFQSQQRLNKLDNVRIALLDGQGQQRVPGILGKVTEIRPTTPPAFVVDFSFIPQEAGDLIMSLKN